MLDTGGFAAESTHVVDSGTTNLTVTGNFDLGDAWGVDREGSFHADATGHLTDDEGFADTMTATLDNDALIDLNTLFLVLDDAVVDLDGVAAGELWDIFSS